MAKYVVLHTQAGPFPQGRVVTDEEIVKAGHDVKHWLSHDAIKPEGAPDRPVKPGESRPVSAPHPRADAVNAELDKAREAAATAVKK